MTQKQASIEEKILSDKLHVREWDYKEDEYCHQWFGKQYLGNGFVKCEYCLETPVQFKGYFKSHICVECQESLKNLA